MIEQRFEQLVDTALYKGLCDNLAVTNKFEQDRSDMVKPLR